MASTSRNEGDHFHYIHLISTVLHIIICSVFTLFFSAMPLLVMKQKKTQLNPSDFNSIFSKTTQSSNGVFLLKSYIPSISTGGTRKKLFELGSKMFDLNKKPDLLVFGDKEVLPFPSEKILYPICPLNNLFKEQTGTVLGAKFFGCMLPPTLQWGKSAEEILQETRFVFYKKDNFEDNILLDYTGISALIQGGETIITYTKKHDNIKIALGEDLPNAPEPIVLQHEGNSRIVMILEKPFIKGGNSATTNSTTTMFYPSVALRKQSQEKDTWKNKAYIPEIMFGVTNLFYFINGEFYWCS